MKAIELANLLLALPEDQQQLQVMIEDEIWIDTVDTVRLTYLDESNEDKESLDELGRVVKTSRPIIALWGNGYDEGENDD